MCVYDFLLWTDILSKIQALDPTLTRIKQLLKMIIDLMINERKWIEWNWDTEAVKMQPQN